MGAAYLLDLISDRCKSAVTLRHILAVLQWPHTVDAHATDRYLFNRLTPDGFASGTRAASHYQPRRCDRGGNRDWQWHLPCADRNDAGRRLSQSRVCCVDRRRPALNVRRSYLCGARCDEAAGRRRIRLYSRRLRPARRFPLWLDVLHHRRTRDTGDGRHRHCACPSARLRRSPFSAIP